LFGSILRKVDTIHARYEDVNWINLAEAGVQWVALVIAAIHL
jgi:hypothetical protein